MKSESLNSQGSNKKNDTTPESGNHISSFKEPEPLYYTIAKSIPDGTVTIDKDGVILYCNNRFIDLVSMPADQVLGASFLGFFQKKDRSKIEKLIQENDKANSQSHFEAQFNTDIKKFVRLEYIHLDMKGAHTALFIVTDITKHILDNEQINLQASYLQKVRDAIIASDKDYKPVYWNAAAESLYGWKAEEVLGKNVRQLLQTQTSRPFNEENYREIVHKRGFWFGEVTQVKKDGTRFPCEISVTILHDENGDVSGFISVNRDVSQRKVAEGMLSEFAEASPDGILMVNQDGKTILVNSRMEEMFGYLRDEFFGKAVEELLPERFRDKHRAHRDTYNAHPFRRLMGKQLELFAMRKDGSEFPVEISLTPLTASVGQVIAVIVRDVTEQKQARQELLESEEKFANAFKYAPIGITLVALDGHFLKVNGSLCKMLGYSTEEFLAKSFQDITHPDDLETDLAHLADVLAGHINSYQMEKRYIHKDGHMVWASLSVSIVRKNDGKPSFFISQIQDITDRKQAEIKIAQQIKRLTTLREIDQAIAGSTDIRLVLTIALQHLLTNLNVDASVVLLLDPIEKTLNYEFGLGLQSSALKYTHLRLGEGFAGQAALTRQTVFIKDLKGTESTFQRSPTFGTEGFVSYFGIPLITKGNVEGVLEIFQRSQIQPDKDWLSFMESLAGQIAIAIDNARLVRRVQQHAFEMELRVEERTAELNKLNLELQHANRTKDEFLANMSHELRTPLNSILGLTESLLEQTNTSLKEKEKSWLKVIESSGQHLLDLINDILDLSKIEAGKFDVYPQPMEVDSLCRSCLNVVKNQAIRKSINLIYQQQNIVSTIHADPRRLKQILVNLLTNAIKFTPQNGKVTLQVYGDAHRDLVQFSVLDNGIGIAPNDLKQLFKPFVQVDSNLNRQFEGTGLGLSLVQKLTDLHGGSVEVESEVGVGSRFTVNIPWGTKLLHQPEPIETGEYSISSDTTEEAIDTSPSEKAINNELILLAEDNVANILTIGEYLESCGYRIVNAHDGIEAIQLAEETNPDIILMDIQMPVMDGIEAMHHLRNNPRFKSTPIIALTALAMPGDRERCLKAGANEYISKPASLKHLRKTIQTLIVISKN